MTSPQDPWQQGGYQQNPYGPPPGGFSPPPGQGPPGQPYPYQAYPGQQPFGQAPEMRDESLRTPGSVQVAFWIAIVVPLLATVLTVASYLALQGFMQDAVEQGIVTDPAVTAQEEQMLRGLTNGILIFVAAVSGFFCLVLTGLWILFGFKMRSGANWARVTLTVFASIWIITSLFGLLSGGMTFTGEAVQDVETPVGYLVLTYGNAGLGFVGMIAFVVLVFLSPSNRYFQAARHL